MPYTRYKKSKEPGEISVTLIDSMGTDLSVVNAARVSFGKKKEEIDNGDVKLINYLGRHKHISPFGHCFATFHVTAPIFVARQLVKHKFLRWNEISRRYVSTQPEFYEPALRESSNDKKQGSGQELKDTNRQDALISRAQASAVESYNLLLEQGICEEQARIVLPQSMITEWYWSGSLDAFADMCNLRCKPDTQLETSYVGKEIDTIMSTLFPYSWTALRK